MKFVETALKKSGAAASAVLETIPFTAPFRPYIETGSRKAGRLVARAVTNDAGQADLTSSVVRTAIIVALTLLVVGVIIWRAVVNLGRDVGRDIEAAGNWGG
jgi:hypothetical protein